MSADKYPSMISLKMELIDKLIKIVYFEFGNEM